MVCSILSQWLGCVFWFLSQCFSLVCVFVSGSWCPGAARSQSLGHLGRTERRTASLELVWCCSSRTQAFVLWWTERSYGLPSPQQGPSSRRVSIHQCQSCQERPSANQTSITSVGVRLVHEYRSWWTGASGHQCGVWVWVHSNETHSNSRTTTAWKPSDTWCGDIIAGRVRTDGRISYTWPCSQPSTWISTPLRFY